MDLDIPISKRRFKKIREWNRNKNYYLKGVKLSIRMYIAKLIWDKRRKSEFDMDSVRTVLILRNEGTVGDVVVSTPLIKCLHEAGYTIDLLLTKSSSAVIKYNPYVRFVYEADDCNGDVFLKGFRHTVASSTIKTLSENNYDLVIDPCLFDTPVHRMMLLRDINARSVLGFNKKKGINHYSKSIYFENGNEHVTKAISLIASCMGVKLISNRSYDLHMPDGVLDEVRRYFNAWDGGKKIIINAFTGNPERNFSQDQLAKTIDMLNKNYSNLNIVILDHRQEVTIPIPDNVVINPFLSLYHVMALIHEADMVISPDTSIVHISATWQKALVSVYKDIADNNDLWSPGYANASQIIVHNRKISDVGNVPKLILHEINQRGLLGRSVA